MKRGFREELTNRQIDRQTDARRTQSMWWGVAQRGGEGHFIPAAIVAWANGTGTKHGRKCTWNAVSTSTRIKTAVENC